MENTARTIIWPAEGEGVLVRVVVLHVGQGSSAVVLAADGNGSYKVMLVDINQDEGADGIDVPALVTDLVGDEGLDVFANTHPHNDHLCGTKRLSDAVAIAEVWHSGHVPSSRHEGVYKELQDLIKKVKDAGGFEVELDGSRNPTLIGTAECYILAPATHVKDDISDETPEGRDERIHEHCAVLRIGNGTGWILIPGDADLVAWENHITEYHRERLPSCVLLAAHHGSRTFFVKDEDDEPYMEGLEAIDPDYVIVSAPRQEESKHGHPHDYAMDLYMEHVGEDNVFHTGKDRYSFICDVLDDGTCVVKDDGGALAEAYPYVAEDDQADDGEGQKSAGPSVIVKRDISESRPFA